MDRSPPGFSVSGILQVKILEWVAIHLSRGSPWPRGWSQVSWIASRFFTVLATREALRSYSAHVYVLYVCMCCMCICTHAGSPDSTSPKLNSWFFSIYSRFSAPCLKRPLHHSGADSETQGSHFSLPSLCLPLLVSHSILPLHLLSPSQVCSHLSLSAATAVVPCHPPSPGSQVDFHTGFSASSFLKKYFFLKINFIGV